MVTYIYLVHFVDDEWDNSGGFFGPCPSFPCLLPLLHVVEKDKEGNTLYYRVRLNITKENHTMNEDHVCINMI